MTDLSGPKQLQLLNLIDKPFYFYTLGLLSYTPYVPQDLLFQTLRKRFNSLPLIHFQRRIYGLEELGLLLIISLEGQGYLQLKSDYQTQLQQLYQGNQDAELNYLHQQMHQHLKEMES